MDTRFERKNIGSSGKDEWLTPPEIIEALGKFDLDPCSPIDTPFKIADNTFNVIDNGLMQNWEGRVFCNPPYGKEVASWLDKCVMHQNCIALVFARTETNMFFNYVWGAADSILFIKGRLQFYNIDGICCDSNAGAPSVLISYNKENSEILKNCNIKGKFINLKSQSTN